MREMKKFTIQKKIKLEFRKLRFNFFFFLWFLVFNKKKKRELRKEKKISDPEIERRRDD